jgi:hypothetical protein
MNGTRLPPDALLNKQQVADILNVSPRTLDRLRSQGLVEAVNIRSRVLFRPAAVAAFIAKNTRYDKAGLSALPTGEGKPPNVASHTN